MNKKIAAGLAAGLLAGTGAGLILEISGSAGASSNVSSIQVGTDDTTDTTNTSGTADTTKPDPSTRLQEILKPLVDDGTLTQAQADKVVAALAAAGPIGGDHGGRGGRGGANFGLVATTLGMTEAEVRDAISNGQTLAQLAEAKGSSGQALIDVLVAAEKTRLDAEVAAGEHTQAEADTKLADATTRITDFVNNTQTAGPAGGQGGPGGPGGHHGRGDADGDGPGAGTDTNGGTTTPIDGGPTDSTTATGA